MPKKKTITIKKIIRFLNFGIFPGTVCFCSGFTVQEIISKLKTKKYKELEEYAECLNDEQILNAKFSYFAHSAEMVKNDDTIRIYFIILIPPFLFEDSSYVILAHEVLHICQFFLKNILDRKNEIEAEAYLHSHLMTQALKELR